MSTGTPKTLCPICHQTNRPDARFCQKCGKNIWLNTKYRITRAIKEGGMGAVYEAVDDKGKRYALKALIDRFTDEKERAEAIARFSEEASLLHELKHPRIPRVYDHFKHGERYYLAMDFVEGDDLEDLQHKQPGQRFPERTVLEWADQIADVLDYLHRQRLIYRDVKPSNIMIERATGAIKVVDFGIAKLFQPHERGTLIGTPGYSPPEQYQGQATPVSDVYAFGATLHHLLTGRDPREEAPFSFPPLRSLVPEISAQTEAAVTKALAMDPAQRWQSAAAFRAALPYEVIVRPKRQQQAPAAPPPQAAARSAGNPAAQAKPARPPKPPKPAKQPKPSAAAPAPPKAKPRRRGRWLFPLLVVAIAAGLIGLGQPGASDWLSERFPGLLAAPPTATNTGGVARSESFEIELTISVPFGTAADDPIVRERFLEAYRAAAVEKYGDTAVVNMSIPPTYAGGAPRLAGETASETSYTVSMQGRVSWRP